MAKLTVIYANDRTEFDLGPKNTLGRHPNNSIQILDRIISKMHAEIDLMPDKSYRFKDLGSLNGTYHRGERINEVRLQDGDEITLGSTRLVFSVVAKPKQIAQSRVTIIGGVNETHIRQKIAASSRDFLPEKEMTNIELLRRDYEKLRIGHELAQAISNELDLEKLLPKILEKAFELVGASRGTILLMENNELVPRYVKTRDGRNEENIIISKTVTSEVITNREAVLSSDASMDSRFSGAHSIIMQGIRSTMTLPLLYRDEILGIMHLDSQIATNAFNEKDLQICTGMAAQAAVAIKNASMAVQIEKEANTRAQMSRLIPKSVVDQVVKGELTLEKGGRLSEITMLFSDIRGFTSMSDGRPPQEVVKMLNDYFEVMVEILFRHSGALDKFVGDEIIGLFGAPPMRIQDAEYKAVLCALDMVRALDEFNHTVRRGLPPLKIGIGINTGKVIFGAIGSTEALQYTAIGDAMNVASRLVALAGPSQIIISHSTFRKLNHLLQAEPLPPVKVKGKAESMQVYRVIGVNDWNSMTHG